MDMSLINPDQTDLFYDKTNQMDASVHSLDQKWKLFHGSRSDRWGTPRQASPLKKFVYSDPSFRGNLNT